MRCKGIFLLMVVVFALLFIDSIGFIGAAAAGCSEDNDPIYKAEMEKIDNQRKKYLEAWNGRYEKCCGKPTRTQDRESSEAKWAAEAQLMAELKAKKTEWDLQENKAYENCKKRSEKKDSSVQALWKCQDYCKKNAPRDSSGIMIGDWYDRCHDNCSKKYGQ